MNPSLNAKLFLEYSSAAADTKDAQVALHMAAFYQGIYGAQFLPKKPFDLIAQVQWKVKAIESDSQMMLFRDEAVFVVAKRMRSRLLFFRDISFQSPNFDLNKLVQRLRMLALRNQTAAQLLNLLLNDKLQSRLGGRRRHEDCLT
jgi:hypothetical protein